MKNEEKKILIVENLDTHTPYIVTLMSLFNENKEIKPFVIADNKIKEEIRSNFKGFYKKNKELIFTFGKKKRKNNFSKKFSEIGYYFNRTRDIIKLVKKKEIDILYLNTPEGKRNLFLLTYLLFTKKKVILTHHDSVFDKNLGSIFLFFLKKVIKKSLCSVFLGDYLKYDPIFENKKKLFINYVYNTSEKKQLKKYDKITFVLNNTPKIKNRDYVGLFNAFNELVTENPSLLNKFQIIIPLKVWSEELIELIENSKVANITTYYKNYVPEEKLISILKKSHYSIIPLFPYSKSGTSRITASFSYNCAYKISTIVSENYLKHAKNKNDYPYIFEYLFKGNSLKDLLHKLITKKYSQKIFEKHFEKYNKMYSFKSINHSLNKILST